MYVIANFAKLLHVQTHTNSFNSDNDNNIIGELRLFLPRIVHRVEIERKSNLFAESNKFSNQ